MSEEKKETRRIPWLWIGLVFTVGIFGFGFYLAFQQNCYWQGPSPAGCMPNWKYFLNSPPNEMGDTLAGFAGALAFIWLVVAVMLQNQELRHALDEYEKMADAMQRQADVAGEQLENLKVERRLRQEAEAKDAFAALIEALAIVIRSESWKEHEWQWANDRVDGGGRSREVLFSGISNGVDGDLVVRELHKKVERLHTPLVSRTNLDGELRARIKVMPAKRQNFLDFIETCKELILFSETLSHAERIRFRAYKLDLAVKMLEEMRDAPIWSNEE